MLGPLQSLALVERTADNDRRRSRYLAAFPHQRLLLTVGLDHDDRIGEFRLEAE